jgi:hypothetical protein
MLTLNLSCTRSLEPVVASTQSRLRVDRYRAVLSAFEISRKLDLLDNPSLLLTVLPLIITEIYRLITDIPIRRLAQPPALPQFIRKLEDEVKIGVFTLNYDDVVDGARGTWLTALLVR